MTTLFISIACVLIGIVLGVVLANKVPKEPEMEDQTKRYQLLHYYPYTDVSYGDNVPSCRFTVLDLQTSNVYNRRTYGSQYSVEQLKYACVHGTAHKLGSKA